MKRLFVGMIIGVMISLLLSAPFALAGRPIGLVIDGQAVQCDVPPQLINGRVLVPARFVAEPLGASVRWDANNNAVVIDSGKQTLLRLNAYIDVARSFTAAIPVLIQTGDRSAIASYEAILRNTYNSIDPSSVPEQYRNLFYGVKGIMKESAEWCHQADAAAASGNWSALSKQTALLESMVEAYNRVLASYGLSF